MTTNNRKIAIITGASRGLGKSTAIHLAKKGVDAIVTYHSNAEEAAKVVAEIESIGAKAVALQLDTANTKTFDDFVVQVKQSLQAKWQTDRFDFLINNAGTGAYASFSDTTEEDFDHLMNIHVKGVFFLTQKLLARSKLISVAVQCVTILSLINSLLPKQLSVASVCPMISVVQSHRYYLKTING
jgi:NAD(P)-dependent dehydrogenase (short-subunit alcohol dehydrogenase family)